MTFIQPARPGQWGKFSTPAVQNKVIISGSFNNYGGGGFGVPMMPMGGGMMMGGCSMDYGCCGGGMKPFWGGFLGGFLGSIGNFFGFGGGGGASAVSYGAGYPGGITGGAAQLPGSDGLDGLREVYPDNKFSKIGNSYVCVTKDGKQITGRSPEDLLNKLGNGTEATTRSGDGDKTLKDKAQLQEECDIFNGKYKGKGTLEIITDPNDPNFGEYKLTYKDKDGNEKIETVKTIIDAQKLIGGGTVDDGADGVKDKGSEDDGADGVKGKGGEDDGVIPGDDGGRGSTSIPGDKTSMEAFDKIFGKGNLPEGCQPVYDDDGKTMIGVNYNGKTYTTPDALMKALNGVDLVSSEGFDINSLNGKTFDIIDHGPISDIANAKASGVKDGIITIGDHTYQVINTDDSGHVYLKATDDTRQTEIYILEKANDNKYRLSQYMYTEKGQTSGQGKAAYGGRGSNIA